MYGMNVFYSARLKLTVFYFAILLVFCGLLTFAFQVFAAYELDKADDAQIGAIHQLVERYYSEQNFGAWNDQPFAAAQDKQLNETQARLKRDFLLIDTILLGAGAVLSYWYAGRTLKPIEEFHERQKRFTSDASHELRTPLTSIKIENEVFLRQKSFTEAEARELITSNLEEVERLEKLATNLLALSQYEDDTVAHQPSPVVDMVEEAVRRAKRSRAAKKVSFAQNIQPATVDVNKDSIVELFTILLDNAIKYGGAKGKVEIQGTLNGQEYTLTVRDHGPGIAEKDMPHIFERMYRGDEARSSKVSGHGIGLSLAKQIAMANDVLLSARNHQEGGAEFIVVFR